MPIDSPAQPPEPRGYVDRFDGTTLIGWAFDGRGGGGGGGFCTVAILLDGRIVGTAVADQHRMDLEAAGLGAGCCAFRFDLPPTLLRGGRQSLSVRLAGSGRELEGSPIEIVGAGPDLPEDGGTLLPWPAAGLAATPHTPLAKGPNPVAPGIWIEGMENAVGVALYACGPFEGFPAPTPTPPRPGIRIRAPAAGGHLRVVHELRPLRSLLAGPSTLSLTLRREGEGPAPSVELAVGTFDGHGFTPAWTQPLTRIVPGLQECTVRLEPAPLNAVMACSRAEEAKAVVVVTIRGIADLVLSPARLDLGAPPPEDDGEPLRDFEDPAVRDQWPDLTGPAGGTAPTPAPAGTWTFREILNVPEIVVPVFNAPQAVAECLAALRAHTTVPHLLTLVDDGSFPETAVQLDRAAAAGPWCRVLRAARNEGYTVAVNRAVASAAGEVVVLLNSDTMVTPGWLEGLLDALTASPNTMMSGPMSNAASWQSLPALTEGGGEGALGTDWALNRLTPGESPQDRARLLGAVSRRAFPAVPVLNGFCLAIRRRLFDAIGLFDAGSFPAGYGEENDFCQRTADAGFTMRVADHVYVHHHKTRSFGTERRRALLARADAVLAARYGRERLQALNAAMEGCTALTELRRAFNTALAGTALATTAVTDGREGKAP